MPEIQTDARSIRIPLDRAAPITSVGFVVFALTMIGVGSLGLVNRSFTAVWQPVLKNVPASAVLAYMCAFVSVVSGIGLLWARRIYATRVLLAFLLLWLLVFRVPPLLHGFTVDAYWAFSQNTVLLAAAWVLYAWFGADWEGKRVFFLTGATGLRIARALYGLAIIPFGLAHFQYVQHTASMVPAWLPAHVAWAYFTGGAFVAAGLAILIGLWARLAASLSALQMGLFLALVWIPAAATRSLNRFEWGEVLITWVLTAAAWVVADSYRGIRWFGGG